MVVLLQIHFHPSKCSGRVGLLPLPPPPIQAAARPHTTLLATHSDQCHLCPPCPGSCWQLALPSQYPARCLAWDASAPTFPVKLRPGDGSMHMGHLSFQPKADGETCSNEDIGVLWLGLGRVNRWEGSGKNGSRSSFPPLCFLKLKQKKWKVLVKIKIRLISRGCWTAAKSLAERRICCCCREEGDRGGGEPALGQSTTN